jgi:hypothetical protein
MVEQLAGIQRRKGAIFGIALMVIVVVAVDLYAIGKGLSYRELIVAFGALIGGIVVFGREGGIRFGFVLWALTLALGYRSLQYTKDLTIHPAEILLWLLFFCILAQRELVATTRLALPFWMWLLVPFCVLAWWPLIAGDASWDKMLNEFRAFLLLVPLMVVGPVVLQRKGYWRYLLLAFFFASTWIALMGVIEYWFPEVTKLFPSFMSQPNPVTTADGFMRAQFSFWGGAPATFVCVLALPSAVVLMRWWPNSFHRAAIVAASILQIVAIYIGGYRSIWLLLLIQVVIACLLGIRKGGAAVAFICLVVAFAGYQFIPKTSERAFSGIAALQGRPIDSSATDRMDRAAGALNQAYESPFGSGWASAGWVHSDFLQVTVNLGIIAGLIFLGGYIYTLLRLGRRLLPYLRGGGEHGDLGFTLLLSFVAAGGLLAMEGVEVLPQFVLPVWFVWTLVEVWLQQTPDLRNLYAAPLVAYPDQVGALDYRAV